MVATETGDEHDVMPDRELTQAGSRSGPATRCSTWTTAPIADLRRLAGMDRSSRWACRGAATTGEASTMATHHERAASMSDQPQGENPIVRSTDISQPIE
jgi:hypothetical protein